MEFSSAREGMKSPLAKKLFTIDGITSVFFGSDFMTVTKKDEYSWPVLKPDIFAAIMDFYSSGEPLISDAQALAASDTAIHPDDSEVGGWGEGQGGGKQGEGGRWQGKTGREREVEDGGTPARQAAGLRVHVALLSVGGIHTEC